MAFNLTSGQWYTAKYRAEFTGDQGTSRIVEIHEDGYDFRTDGPSSLPNPMTGVGRANVSTSYAREGENEFAALAPSEATLSVYDDFASDSIATDLLNDIQTVSDKYAIVIRDGNTLRWVGKIDPEGIEYQEEGPIPLSVTATCGIGRLANLPYSTATDSTAAAPSGLDTFTDVIADILDGTGFGLDFYVSSSLYHKTSPTLAATDNPLENTYVDKLAFSQNDNDGQQKLVSKRAVLEAICNGWGLVCFQFDGAYHLIQADHFHANSYRRWQYNSSGVLQGNAVVDPRVSVSDENVKRTVSTKSFLKAYNSAAVSYQHGPIQILQYPDFTITGIGLTAQEFFGGAYPWSFDAANGPFFVTLGDSGEDQGMKCEAVDDPLSFFSGYEAIDVSAISEFQKGAKFANVTQSAALDTALANRVSEQTTGILQSGFNFGITFQAYARTTGKGSFNPHELSDSWVVLKIKHNGQNQYLKVNTSGQLEWTNTETWFAHRNAVAADDWFNAIWRAEDVANTTADGTITVSIGPIFYSDANAQIWDSVIWDNFQLFTQLDDGTVNYETTTSINYIDRGDPRTFTNTVVIGDGPTAYNKGSMFSDTDRTVTSDWEESTTGHSGSEGLDHSSALSALYLKSMRKMRATHTSSYDGYGDVLGPLDVLNRTSGLHPFWSIDIDWVAESTSGTWYQADKSIFTNDLETGISKGAHVLGGLGRGSSGDAGFNYNRIGSSFDTLIARESDRLATVNADATSGTTVTCTSLAYALKAGDPVFFQSKKTGYIMKRIVAADAAAAATSFTVTVAFSTAEPLNTGDPILPGSITGMRIDMDGISVINTHIKSDNWADAPSNGVVDEDGIITTSGTDGWIITKAGEAEFNNAIIRGKIDVGGIRIGKDVGYLTGTGDEPTAGEHGIWINTDNYWILDTNADPDEEFFRVGDDESHINWDGTTGSEAFTIKSQGNIVFDSSSGTNGLGLDGDLEIVDGRIVIGSTPDVVLDSDGLLLSTGSANVNKVRWTTGGVSPTYSEIYTAGPGVMVLNPLTDLSITADSVKINPGVARFVGTSDSGEVGWVTMYANASGYFFRRNGTGSDHRIVDNELLPVATGANGDILYYNSGWQKLAKGSDGQVLTLASGLPSWATGGGGGGSTTFTGLTDTPSSFTGSGSQLVRVNSGATALEFVDGSTLYQPLDSDLTAIAGLSPTTGQIIFAQSGSWTSLPIGSAGTFLKSSFGTPSWTSITASDIASGTFADARIAESSVTQHEAALSITESQISDLGSYITNQKGVANLYSRYGQITVNSTTAVDFLGNSGSYVGTSTVPANSVLQGSIFRIVARGTRQGNASDSHTYTLKLGSTTLLTYTYTPANTFGGYDGWKFEAIVSVNATGSSGTVWAQGQFHNASNIYMFENTATDSYNTTSATDISLEVSTDTNTTATCEVAYIDVSRSLSVV